MKTLFKSVWEFLFGKKTPKAKQSAYQEFRREQAKKQIEKSPPPPKFNSDIQSPVKSKEIRYPKGLILTDKQFWILKYVKEQGKFVSPTEAGKMYGIKMKSRLDYDSGHARACLLRLVKYGLLIKNENGHYKYINV